MLLAALTAAPLIATAETIASPANAPAAIEWKAAEGRLSLRYHGGVIFEATVRAEDASGAAVAGAEVKLEQEYRFFFKTHYSAITTLPPEANSLISNEGQ